MISLTPTQNKTVAIGISVLAISVVLAFVLVLGWAAVRFLELIAPALIPVILGIFLAMLFKPYFEWWRRIVKNPTLALSLTFASVLVPMGFIIWNSGTFLIEQVAALASVAPTIITRLSAWVNATFPKAQGLCASLGLPADQMLFFTDPAQFSHDVVAQLSAAYGADAMKAGVGALKYLSSLGTALLTLIFFVFFLLRPDMRGADYVRFAPFLKEDTRLFAATQIDAFLDIVVGFFRRQVVICLVEGVLYGTGFALVGLPYGFVLGFLLGVLNLVPLFGTIVVMPAALPLAYFGDGGSLLHVIMVAIVWLTGQVLDGYCITPLVQGNRTGLGFAGVIFSFLFWGIVFHSMIGLLLAIPLSAFCVVLWRALKAKYIKAVI